MSRSRIRGLVGGARVGVLCLAVAVLVLWAVSFRYGAAVTGHPFNHDTSIRGGALVLQWFTLEPNGSVSGFGNPGWTVSARSAWTGYWLPRLDTSTPHHVAVIPLWLVVLFLGVGAHLLGRLRRRLAWPDLCPACEYPRAGLPAGAPCPECGRQSLVRRIVAGWRGRSGELGGFG